MIGTCAIAAALLFARVHTYPLLGLDTFPAIATSQISNFGDFIGTFTEQSAEGYFPHAFYRPVFNLAFALDFALSGVEPTSYYVTSVILFACSGIALFVLTRRLLGPTAHLGPWVALLGFLLMPVQMEIVPILSRRMDLLCGLFSILALTTQIPRIDQRTLPGSLLPALFTLFAVGSKEPGVILPVLVFALVVFLQPAEPFAKRCRRAALVALPHLLAVALVVIARLIAIGGVGGHPSTSLIGAITRLPWALGTSLVRLSSLWMAPDPINIWLLYFVAISCLGLMVVVWIRALSTRAEQSSDDGPARSVLVAVALGLGWLVLLCSIYGINGQYRAWYLYLPGQAVAVLVGAVVQWLSGLTRGPTHVGSVLGISLACFWIGAQARHSPLVRDYAHWRVGAELAEQYLVDLSARIEAGSDGTVISIRYPPKRILATPNPMGAEFALVLSENSLRGWAELKYPDRKIRFVDRDANAEPGELIVRIRPPRKGPGGRKKKVAGVE